MSRIAIFGAATPLGAELVSAAVTGGHEVNAIVSDASRFRRAHDAIDAFEADLRVDRGVQAAVERCGRVVCELTDPETARGLVRLAQSIRGAGHVKRMIFLSSAAPASFLANLFSKADARRREAERVAAECPLPYALLRFSRLATPSGCAVVEVVGPGDALPGEISRGTFARTVIQLAKKEIWGRELVVGARPGSSGIAMLWRTTPLPEQPAVNVPYRPRRSKPPLPDLREPKLG